MALSREDTIFILELVGGDTYGYVPNNLQVLKVQLEEKVPPEN